MNPIPVSETLRRRYFDYLVTNFGVSEQFPELLARMKQLLGAPGQLIHGPFLEATAPFKLSPVTARGLVGEGVLCKEFEKLFATPFKS
jgi:hypothetical protein